MNTIALNGRVGADPEITQTNTGTAVMKFSVAESRKKKDDWITIWRTVKMFGKKVDDYKQRVTKGAAVLVFGSLEQDQYVKDGEKKFFDYIIASGIHVVEKAGPIQDSAHNASNDSVNNDNGFSADDIPF